MLARDGPTVGAPRTGCILLRGPLRPAPAAAPDPARRIRFARSAVELTRRRGGRTAPALRAEGPSQAVEKLKPLGLGPRATEVLYWASQGKTNEEVGVILGMATGTVKTHLKNVFTRLGVENRGSAAVAVSEFLGRPF
jgi:DNA-binding CsgD family transcriptional regulator